LTTTCQPTKARLQPLGISFPFSCVSSQCLHFSTLIGKEFALGRAPQKRNEKNPLATPPGIRSKYGKTNAEWHIVYDPKKDKVLIWTNHRVRIYQRRGHRLFIYQKGKSENTFPQHALPISGEWQGSNFIVTNTSHWTNPPTETLPQQCVTQHQLPQGTTQTIKWKINKKQQPDPKQKSETQNGQTPQSQITKTAE
jgi:hypothetical protein